MSEQMRRYVVERMRKRFVEIVGGYVSGGLIGYCQNSFMKVFAGKR